MTGCTLARGTIRCCLVSTSRPVAVSLSRRETRNALEEIYFLYEILLYMTRAHARATQRQKEPNRPLPSLLTRIVRIEGAKSRENHVQSRRISAEIVSSLRRNNPRLSRSSFGDDYRLTFSERARLRGFVTFDTREKLPRAERTETSKFAETFLPACRRRCLLSCRVCLIEQPWASRDEGRNRGASLDGTRRRASSLNLARPRDAPPIETAVDLEARPRSRKDHRTAIVL